MTGKRNDESIIEPPLHECEGLIESVSGDWIFWSPAYNRWFQALGDGGREYIINECLWCGEKLNPPVY